MAENICNNSQEVIDNTGEEKEIVEIKKSKDKGPFTFEKILGVAVAGAFSSLLLYYIYNSLSEETRSSIIAKIKSSAKTYASEVVPDLMKQGVEKI